MSYLVRRMYDSVDRVEPFAFYIRCYLVTMRASGEVAAKL